MTIKIKRKLFSVLILFTICLTAFLSFPGTTVAASDSKKDNGTGEPILLRFIVNYGGSPAQCIPVFAKYVPSDSKYTSPSFQHLQLLPDWNDATMENWRKTLVDYNSLCGSSDNGWLKAKGHFEPVVDGDTFSAFASQDGRFRTSRQYGDGLPKIKNGTVSAYVKFKIVNQESWVDDLADVVSPYNWYQNVKDAISSTDISYEGSVEVKIKNYIDNISYPPGETGMEITADGAKYPLTTSFQIGDKTVYAITNVDPIPINVVQKKTENSVITKAIRAAAGTVLDFAVSAIGWSINLINKLLDWTQEETLRTSVKTAWVSMRNIGISFLMFILIIIAFANALQINIEKYGVGRMIPKIIISIIMAYFSWLIVMFFFDFTNVLQSGAAALVGGVDPNQWSKVLSGSTSFSAGSFASSIALLLLAVAIVVGILICLCILLFSLLVRVLFLSFLLAVAPLAFICNILPFTESMYKSWWSSFFKWMFMGPAAVFILALGVIIAGGGNASFQGTPLDETTITSLDAIFSVVVIAASIYLAATLPLKWGGQAMTGWQKLGKGMANMGKKGGAWGYNTAMDTNKYTRGLTTTGIKSFFKGRKADIEGRRAAAGTVLRAGAADRLRGAGRFAAGTKGYQQTALHSAAVSERAKVLGTENMSLDDLKSNVFKSSGYDQEAYVQELVNRGLMPDHLDSKANGGKGDFKGQKIFDECAKRNGAIANSAFKNQLGLAINSTNTATQIGGLTAAKNKATHDLTKGSYEGIARALDSNDSKVRQAAMDVTKNWTRQNAENLKLNAGQISAMKEVSDKAMRLGAISPEVASTINARAAGTNGGGGPSGPPEPPTLETTLRS